jgi:hypothetical protein
MNEYSAISEYGKNATLKCLAEIIINCELVRIGAYPKYIEDMQTSEEYLEYKKFADLFMKKNFG